MSRLFKSFVKWLDAVTSDDHIISRMAGVPTLAETKRAREPHEIRLEN